MSLSRDIVVIPVYNESAHIGAVLPEVLKHTTHVVVVDNASKDDTVAIVKRFPVAFIAHDKNQGKAQSIKDGFKYAIDNGFDNAIMMDGDGEHDPVQIPQFLDALKHNDFVLGERDVFRSKRRSIVNAWSKVWFGLIMPGISDPQCGYKGIRISLLRTMDIQSEGFGIELELILEAFKRGAKIQTIPIKTDPLAKTHVRLIDYVRINNFFDRWVIKNRRELRVRKLYKLLLVPGAGIGLAIGTLLQWCLSLVSR
jgi:glycosyltransferase involved in cell wall biosynthesis